MMYAGPGVKRVPLIHGHEARQESIVSFLTVRYIFCIDLHDQDIPLQPGCQTH